MGCAPASNQLLRPRQLASGECPAHAMRTTELSRETIDFIQHPPVPSFLIKDVLAKLAYIDERVKMAEVSGAGDNIRLIFSTVVGDAEVSALQLRVASLVHAMADGAFEPDLRVLEEQKSPVRGGPDPMPELLARREVVQEGPGYFVLGPLLTQVVSYVEAKILEVAADMGAIPFRFPALISPRYLEKVQYFKNFPHSLTFATHLRGNLPDVQRFAAEATATSGLVEVDGTVFAPPVAMLAPTVCHHLYLTLSDSELPAEGLIATASGNCFRYESINMVSLERVWNFSMREIIFVGGDEHVNAHIQEVRERIRPILESLNLSYEVTTATDPFFIGTFRDQAAYQAAFELKYEVRALLPYKDDTIAIASYNRHGDFFGRTLNILMPDGSPACTGCFGMGFERMAFAFVAQHGIDPANWPDAVRDAVKLNAGNQKKYSFRSIRPADACPWC